MSKEFNYKRAWQEYVLTEFNMLDDSIIELYHLVEEHVDGLKQDGARHALLGEKVPFIVSQLDGMPVEQLAWASQVVYWYGHLASNKAAQAGGLYWKFQMLADASVINRGGSLALDKAKQTMDEALKAFHDHKEGTEYDDEEAGEILAKVIVDGVSVLKVDHVNHTPDVFCIGPKHLKLSTGMYLDPNVAPCTHCGKPYSEHKSDRVAFVKVLNPDDKTKLQGALKSLLTACETSSIKLDGFALIK